MGLPVPPVQGAKKMASLRSQLIRMVEAAGGVYVRTNRHHVLRLPNGKMIAVASSPSEPKESAQQLQDRLEATTTMMWLSNASSGGLDRMGIGDLIILDYLSASPTLPENTQS